MSAPLSRRDWLRLSTAGAFGVSMSGWFPLLAGEAAAQPERKRSCILLWMTGGPSQIDTFDPKPGHANAGPLKAIDTSVPGIQISQHLPRIAGQMEHLAVIRSMKTREGDHGRATHLIRTGYAPQPPIQYPTMGSFLSKELGREGAVLPDFISVAPYIGFNAAAFGPGFLGPKYSPLVVGSRYAFGGTYNDQALQVQNLKGPPAIDDARSDARLSLLDDLETEFTAVRPGVPTNSHRSVYDQAVRLMRSSAARAFDLTEEPDKLRDAYGRHLFGQGCLLARRLVEHGVPFVEVSLNGVGNGNVFGWDTHQNNFDAVQQLSAVLDSGWGTLMLDLKERGLLESTLVIWMGEFGRTPTINNNRGRDHYPNAWSAVLGGAIRGGQVVGKTNPAGTEVVERPVSQADLMATICKALGLDPRQQNLSDIGRPIRLADPEAKVIEEVLA